MTYNPNNDFQKIPKEEFESGISDTAQSYQAGYIAGIEKGKDRVLKNMREFYDGNSFVSEKYEERIMCDCDFRRMIKYIESK